MTRENLCVAARDLRPGDVMTTHGTTINSVDVTTEPGVVYVEVDYTYRVAFHHGEPVEVSREVVSR